jgi:hypothetical protein
MVYLQFWKLVCRIWRYVCIDTKKHKNVVDFKFTVIRLILPFLVFFWNLTFQKHFKNTIARLQPWQRLTEPTHPSVQEICLFLRKYSDFYIWLYEHKISCSQNLCVSYPEPVLCIHMYGSPILAPPSTMSKCPTCHHLLPLKPARVSLPPRSF